MTWLRNLVFGAIKDLIGFVARQVVVLAALYLGGRYAAKRAAHFWRDPVAAVRGSLTDLYREARADLEREDSSRRRT